MPALTCIAGGKLVGEARGPVSFHLLAKDWLETSLGEMSIACKGRTQVMVGHDYE